MDKSVGIKRKAQQLVQKGDLNGAIAEYEKLFDLGDRDPYDFILVADLLAKRGSMQDAVRRYRQATDEYTKAELYKNAIAVCKKILRISKEDLAIHRTLGDLYAKEGLYGDAQIHFLEFAEGSIRRQEHDAALDVLDEVLKLSPDNLDLSEKYIEIAMRADQPERGGHELLRRAERARLLGRTDESDAIRERLSTLAPGLVVEPEPATPPAVVESEPVPRVEAEVSEPLARLTLDPKFTQSASASVADLEPSTSAASNGATSEGATDNIALSPPAPAIPAEPAIPAKRSVPAEPAVPAERAMPPEPVAAAMPAVPVSELVVHEDLAREFMREGKKELAAEEYWKGGELAFFRGDLARARDLLHALLAISPMHEAALRRLVDVTAQMGDGRAESQARFDLGEFYVAHEEWDLSRAEYQRCLELDPSNTRAQMRIQRLDALVQGPATSDPVDLDTLSEGRPNSSVRVRDDKPASADTLIDLEEIIDEFKAGVSEQISGEDHESHYDLGMAYMEMGLYDEAIGEFQVASKGGPMELKCLEMIALCFLEKNEPAAAAKELTRALEIPGYGPEETISIRYNLGVANERLGNWDRALQHFEEVYLLNVDFLKVASKVKELKQRLARAQE